MRRAEEGWTLHFVYAIPRSSAGLMAKVERLWDITASQRSQLLQPWYRYGWIRGETNPLPAPGSITVNLYRYFRRRVRTLLYDWRERGEIKCGVNDTILGHPHPNPDTIMHKAVVGGRKCRSVALILPLHYGIPCINEYVQPLLERVDRMFAIMGPYWLDGLNGSPFAKWGSKITSVDMAVDATQYPLVKRHFNAPGQRGFLYIGSNRPEKGCDVLSKTMARLTEFPRGWVGSGADIPYVPRIAGRTRLTPRYMTELAKTYDVFVNTSLSDANPTTILEAMAWGFPVACTPESGYYNMKSVTKLDTTDIGANVRALRELQYAPEGDLVELSRANRRLVERRYTWDRFCATVWQTLEADAGR